MLMFPHLTVKNINEKARNSALLVPLPEGSSITQIVETSNA